MSVKHPTSEPGHSVSQVVSPATYADAETARELAQKFALPYSAEPDTQTELRILIENGKATLERLPEVSGAHENNAHENNLGGKNCKERNAKPLLRTQLSFTTGKTAHRTRQTGGNISGKRQPLARAMGLHKRFPNYIVDATAGVGTDAFVLASLGCPVLMLERQSALCLMLYLALREAAEEASSRHAAARLSLAHIDAQHWLHNFPRSAHTGLCWPEPPQIPGAPVLQEPPDVIYLDPMYPHENRKALARKNMQLIQTLAGPDTDSASLLSAARNVARRRVVVKRPATAPYINNQPPDTDIQSPKTRYDIYFCQQLE